MYEREFILYTVQHCNGDGHARFKCLFYSSAIYFSGSMLIIVVLRITSSYTWPWKSQPLKMIGWSLERDESQELILGKDSRCSTLCMYVYTHTVKPRGKKDIPLNFPFFLYCLLISIEKKSSAPRKCWKHNLCHSIMAALGGAGRSYLVASHSVLLSCRATLLVMSSSSSRRSSSSCCNSCPVVKPTEAWT